MSVSSINQKHSPTRRAPTEADVRAAANLRRIWEAYAERHRITQKDAARAMGITPGSVSQFLSGKVPVGVSSTYRWAGFLECSPYDIRPDLDDLMGVQGPRGRPRPLADEVILGQAIMEVEQMLAALNVELELEEKTRLTIYVYTDAVKNGGKISRDLIRGAVQFG